jgi:hypothetical protein
MLQNRFVRNESAVVDAFARGIEREVGVTCSQKTGLSILRVWAQGARHPMETGNGGHELDES